MLIFKKNEKNIFLLALLTVPLFSAQPNPPAGVGLQSAEYFEFYDQQVQSASKKSDLILHSDPTFFTGKHYDQDLGAYVFKYRNYSPESNRWTSADPSGFPDGPNNYAYAPVPTSELDPNGFKSVAWAVGLPGNGASYEATVPMESGMAQE